jgi:hypothetical protein
MTYVILDKESIVFELITLVELGDIVRYLHDVVVVAVKVFTEIS